MTTIYIPTLIESQAQAEALPVGSISVDADAPGQVPAEVSTKQEDGLWYGQITARSTSDEVVGEFVLVPTVVDVHESEPLGTTRHGAEHIARTPFTCYIDYKETPR